MTSGTRDGDDAPHMSEAPRFDIQLAEADAGGVYANFLTVWHTGHEFTLDFAATQPPQTTDEGTVVPCRVVARVKIPPTLVFDVIKTLNDNMTRYEGVFGDITPPEPRQPEPPQQANDDG